MKSIAVILATLLVGSSAYAADVNNRFFVVGLGSNACKDYTAAPPEKRAYVDIWLAGYISALNRVTPDTYHIVGENTPPQAFNAMIAQYCAANPEDAIATAIHKIIERVQPNRTRKAPN